MWRILFVLLFVLFGTIHSQNLNNCKIDQQIDTVPVVDFEQIKCLAINSKAKNTIIYTFGIWCKPCINHLPNALGLELNYDVDVFVLLIDPEKSQHVVRAKDFFRRYDEKYQLNTSILLLKDAERSSSRNRKYKRFLSQITPKNFENINDMSKYIVLNSNGETIMVTNWKDSKDDPDWTDDKPMLRRLVIPLLTKKNVLEDTSSDDQ